MFLWYMCEFKELYSILILASKICPIRVPTLYYYGGRMISLFKRVLKTATDEACLSSLARDFQARTD